MLGRRKRQVACAAAHHVVDASVSPVTGGDKTAFLNIVPQGASVEGKSRKRKRSICGETVVEQKMSPRSALRADSTTAGNALLCRATKQLAALAAATSFHPSFPQQYGFLWEQESDKEWCVFGAELPPGGELVLIGMDVEMLERSDKMRFPIKVSIVKLAWEGCAEVLFSGFTDPGVSGWESPESPDLEWYTRIHGISREHLLDAQSRGVLHTLSDVHAVLRREVTDLSFLVGHSLENDLKCLRVRGAGLHRSIIDTVSVFPRKGNQRPSLKSLVSEHLAGETTWAGFQDGCHDPDRDAAAAVRLVELEAHRLLAGASRHVGGGTPPTLGTLKLRVHAAKAGKIIGREGVTLNGIRRFACEAVTMGLPDERGEREITIRGTEAQARCACAMIREASDMQARVSQGFEAEGSTAVSSDTSANQKSKVKVDVLAQIRALGQKLD